MNDAQILDIFYTKTVSEAQKGKIDCYFTMNIAFNLIIDNQIMSECEELPYDGIMIPTLKVTNKSLFDNLLIEYVKRAIEVYNPIDFAFLNDLDTTYTENAGKEKECYLVKYIICTLFANASFSDFNYPIKFLQSRLAMFDNRILNYDGELDLGYIDSIGARIYVTEEVSPIKSETPYRIKSYLQFDDGYKLLLPEIYAGNNGEKYQLYGIQKTTKTDEIDEQVYIKQIRKGFIAKVNGAPAHYFLAVMLFLSLCSDKKIEVVPFLVERWNAKRIAICDKIKMNTSLSFADKEAEQDKIQNNVTNILIQYFKKLEDTSYGMEFSSLPYELDDKLEINMQDNFESRSVAFNELFRLAKEYQSKNRLNK